MPIGLTLSAPALGLAAAQLEYDAAVSAYTVAHAAFAALARSFDPLADLEVDSESRARARLFVARKRLDAFKI